MLPVTLRIDLWEHYSKGTAYKSETHSGIKLRDIPRTILKEHKAPRQCLASIPSV